MAACTVCGTVNALDASYCSKCGSAPEPPTSPAEEIRKTVTVLFCDVTGSTELGEQLDPESMRKVMARYFEGMRLEIERHGGTIEKFIGDAVAPLRHPDDPLYEEVRSAIQERRTFLIDVQYTNDEGDQRAVTRFVVAPTHDDGTQWLCSVGRHVYLDRPNPR